MWYEMKGLDSTQVKQAHWGKSEQVIHSQRYIQFIDCTGQYTKREESSWVCLFVCFRRERGQMWKKKLYRYKMVQKTMATKRTKMAAMAGILKLRRMLLTEKQHNYRIQSKLCMLYLQWPLGNISLSPSASPAPSSHHKSTLCTHWLPVWRNSALWSQLPADHEDMTHTVCSAIVLLVK